MPDFPKPGIVFKDLTPLLADGPLFAEVGRAIADQHAGAGFDVVAGVEARGFLFAAAVAVATGTGVVPVRKAGKLPWRTVSAAYELEYGEAVVEVHEDAFAEHSGCCWSTTCWPPAARWPRPPTWSGGPAASWSGCRCVVELTALGGRDRLADLDVHDRARRVAARRRSLRRSGDTAVVRDAACRERPYTG